MFKNPCLLVNVLFAYSVTGHARIKCMKWTYCYTECKVSTLSQAILQAFLPFVMFHKQTSHNKLAASSKLKLVLPSKGLKVQNMSTEDMSHP